MRRYRQDLKEDVLLFNGKIVVETVAQHSAFITNNEAKLLADGHDRYP